MAWDRYKKATVSNPEFYPKSAYGIDLNQPMEENVISTSRETINGSVLEEFEENEEDTQPTPATPRKKAGSSQKNKKTQKTHPKTSSKIINNLL